MELRTHGLVSRWAVERQPAAFRIVKADFACDQSAGVCGDRPKVLALMAVMASMAELV